MVVEVGRRTMSDLTQLTLKTSEGRPFKYTWKGSLTVVISTIASNGEEIIFDVFTFMEQPPSVTYVYERCKAHLKEREESDRRYQGFHDPDILLYG
jgi:hypothetical protein